MGNKVMSAGQLLKQANRLKRSGRLDEAIALYYQVIEINPYFAWAYNNLGTALVQQGNLDEAVSCYSESIKINPNSAWLFYSLGDALAQQGDLETAVEYLQKAIEIKPDFYKFYNKLSRLLIQEKTDVTCFKNDEKLFVDLGCGLSKPEGYIGVDKLPGEGVDIVADLTKKFPFPDNSVDGVRAYDFIEHLPNPIHTMNEIWRIGKPNAQVDILVPSTDGRGAFQDPTHVSFWNLHSFFYYCSDYPPYLELCHRYGFKGDFKVHRLKNIYREDRVVFVKADLVVLKKLNRLDYQTNLATSDNTNTETTNYKSKVQLLSVIRFFENDATLLWGFNIESPVESLIYEYQIPVSGWVLGKKSPVVAVEVIINNTLVQQVFITQPRPDVAQVYSHVPDAEMSGFQTIVNIGELVGQGELLIQAVCSNKSCIPLSKIQFQVVATEKQ